MILSIDRYFVGYPNIVGIKTTDTISTIISAGYWTTQINVVSQLINGVFQWESTDLVLIYYSPNNIGFFTYDPINLTFVELIVPGDVSSITAIAPLLANGVSSVAQTGPVILSLASDWVDSTTTPIIMVANQGYTADNGASLSVFSLPTTSSIGDWIEINGKGSGGWKLTQATGQQIKVSPNASTLGATGYIASVNQYDNVRLRCLTANTIWTVVSQQGTGLTIV